MTGMYDLDGPNNTLMTHTEAYTYDNVNRLQTAISQSGTGNATYNLTFSYTQDGSSGNYGNVTCVLNGSTNGLCPQYTFNAATNQISNSGFTYDQAGDLTSDGTHSYTWDGEGRLLTMDGGTTANITYNALGQMVHNLTVDTYYSPAGQRIYGGSYNIVPWGDVALVKYGTATLFVHGNVLQSSTDVTDQTGAEKQDQIFYPWGQSWILHQLPDDGTYATMLPLSSTTGEETGYTLNRDYSKSYGRWLSPDPGGLKVVHLDDPQTWNMYAYVGNNPTTLTDSTGLQCDNSNAQNTCNAHQPSGRDDQAQQQNQPQLVLVVTHDQQQPAPFAPGVTERERTYTIETKKDDGGFQQDTTGKHTVSLSEKQTGGNDKPLLAHPNDKENTAYQDEIHVTGPGLTFTLTQTFHIDGGEANATVYEKTKGGVVSGTHVYVKATERGVEVKIGP